MNIPHRKVIPIPDPQKAIGISPYPVFLLRPFPNNKFAPAIVNQNDEPWLPDITNALEVPESEIRPEDYPKLGDYPVKYPKDGDPNKPGDIDTQAGKMAEWAFATYAGLVRDRIKAYNHWRRWVNFTEFKGFRGEYRRACRLAIDQILRREILPDFGMYWEYDQSALPIYNIQIKFTVNLVDTDVNYETVTSLTITGAALAQQHAEKKAVVLTTAQPDWSSSSSRSSSSSSSFYPD